MATRSFAVNADAVGAWNGSNEYGGDCDHLPVGYMSWLGGPARAFLKFTLDWSGVVQISSAVLYVHTDTGYHGSIGASNTCYVDLVTSSWSEGAHPGETWFLNDQPDYSETVDTGYRASFTARAANTWYSADITAIVNRWAPSTVRQSNGSPGPGVANNGIRIIASNESNSAYRTEFAARETGSTYDAYIVLTYTTNQAPVVDSLDSPNNGATITDDTPDLVFSGHDPDAGDTLVAYDIQVDDSSGFGSPAVNLANQAIGSPANSVQVTHTCAALTRGYTYYWRAAFRDNQGAVSAWSAARQFYLATQPTVDQLSPTGNGFAYIHNLSDLALWTDGAYAKPRVSFRYNSSSGLASASYRVRVYDASSGGSLVADTGTVAWVAGSGSVGVVNIATAMPRNTSRWWTVECTDSAGGTSGESARQQFRVQWGQALYQHNPGASSAAWDFSLGAAAGGQVATLFRTATTDGSGGSFGTTSAWTTNIGGLTPADYVNVLVRLGANTAGTNVTLADMTFTYLGASTAPDKWSLGGHAGDTIGLSTAQRRFGAKSLKFATVAAVDNRYAWQDVPVVPGVTYTLSGYVNTPVPLTGGDVRLRVYQGGGFTNILDPAGPYVTVPSPVVTDTTGQPDGWQRLVMTFTAPPGWTSIRVVPHYTGSSAVVESWYLDGMKLEEGPVATPWQAGAIGSVILDSGGIAVDGAAGGAFRLRGSTGGARDIVELGANGLVFGGDMPVSSPTSGILLVGNEAAGGGATLQLAGGASGSEGGELGLEGAGSNTDWHLDNFAGIVRVFDTTERFRVQAASPQVQVTGDLYVSGSNPVQRVYTAGATWTKPANLHHVIVECVGAGGAGGGAGTGIAGTSSKGGGGGSGGYSRKLVLAASLGATEAVTIGTGGSGVSAGTGNAGGDTSFGAHCIGKGGSGGSCATTNSATYSGALGGAGGVAGTGDLTVPGQVGTWGFSSGALATGGVGAPSAFGGGGQGASLLNQPNQATGAAGTYGGGGGGSARTGTGSAQAGGAGGGGYVIVTEFYGP